MGEETGEPERAYDGEGPPDDPDVQGGDRFESGGEVTSDASDESAYGSSEQHADGSDYEGVTPADWPAEFLCMHPVFSEDASKIYFVGQWWEQ